MVNMAFFGGTVSDDHGLQRSEGDRISHKLRRRPSGNRNTPAKNDFSRILLHVSQRTGSPGKAEIIPCFLR